MSVLRFINSGSKSKFTTSIVVCLVFVIGSGLAQWVFDDEGCRTPDRGVGSCIPIKECLPITNILEKAPKPLSPQIVATLRAYTCGFEGKGVKVCCPQDPIVINDNTKPIKTGPPDVSNHRNYNLLPQDCGLLDEGNRIINGRDAGLLEFPWMALLSYQTSRGPDFKCGGSILNERYILTAAHCITNLKEKLIGVRVGEYDVPNATDCEIQSNKKTYCAPPVQNLNILEIIPHKNYNITAFTNDIGLLRVDKINLKVANAKPVCMPTEESSNVNLDKKNVEVTGWGATETGRNSAKLQKVSLPIVPVATCAETYKKSAPITEKQLCAGGTDRKDSCPGDSGGPMQLASYHLGDTRYVQHGVVSFGPKFCGVNGLPGVYTRISYYMDWILDNIKN